jgi:hypothetical protein
LDEIKNYMVGVPQWHNIHNKFRENQSTGSKIERTGSYKQQDELINLLFHLREESGLKKQKALH